MCSLSQSQLKDDSSTSFNWLQWLQTFQIYCAQLLLHWKLFFWWTHFTYTISCRYPCSKVKHKTSVYLCTTLHTGGQYTHLLKRQSFLPGPTSQQACNYWSTVSNLLWQFSATYQIHHWTDILGKFHIKHIMTWQVKGHHVQIWIYRICHAKCVSSFRYRNCHP